jgi:hypothetical protein
MREAVAPRTFLYVQIILRSDHERRLRRRIAVASGLESMMALGAGSRKVRHAGFPKPASAGYHRPALRV